jgi:hypothetical protein
MINAINSTGLADIFNQKVNAILDIETENTDRYVPESHFLHRTHVDILHLFFLNQFIYIGQASKACYR